MGGSYDMGRYNGGMGGMFGNGGMGGMFGNGGSYEMEFHNTLKNGEFFERWHYMEQRMWKMEQFFMEMAQRMNFSDMEMQMNNWMNSHDSMFRMSSSWMNNMNGMGKFGNNMFGNNNFSKMGNYGFGNDSCFSDGNNFKITPPS